MTPGEAALRKAAVGADSAAAVLRLRMSVSIGALSRTLISATHRGRRYLAVAPLLWRLDHYGIELSKNAAPLMKYAERIFSRPAYIEALTPSEKVMRR